MPYAEAKQWNELYQSMEVQAWFGVKQTKASTIAPEWIKTGLWALLFRNI